MKKIIESQIFVLSKTNKVSVPIQICYTNDDVEITVSYNDTEYWIEIAQKANIISEETAKTVLHDCGSLRRMLIASINTAKENAK